MLEKERGRRVTVMEPLIPDAFRERYGVQFHKDMMGAAEFWRRFPGKSAIEIGRTEHPRAARRGV
jgi:hypothetical protein